MEPPTDTRGLELVPISFPKATQSVTQRAGFLSYGTWPQTQIQLLQLLNPFSCMKAKASKNLLTERMEGGGGKKKRTERKVPENRAEINLMASSLLP